MNLNKTMKISAAALQAQENRMRVIAENLANVDSMATTPGGEPYRRKTVSFRNVLDRQLGVNLLEIGRVDRDKSPLRSRFEPQNPAADADGYVKLPNVNALIEAMDMRQAQRSYEANLTVIEAAKSMLGKAIDLLRS
jgi:flagellar basal-body rod protein FlgC